MSNKRLSFELNPVSALALYTEIQQLLPKILRVYLVYKQDNKEYITENISVEWLAGINSHDFFNGLMIKYQQKQKYNVSKYAIFLICELR